MFVENIKMFSYVMEEKQKYGTRVLENNRKIIVDRKFGLIHGTYSRCTRAFIVSRK